MNYAVILSGGIGQRMRMEGLPKQYIEINGKPILMYTLEKFERSSCVDRIVIVAASQWYEQIQAWIQQYNITKFHGFAPAGSSRQESVLNGLNACIDESTTDEDSVGIHDAVRPLVSVELINSCYENLEGHDGVLPVLPMSDTIYLSNDAQSITSLLDRSVLFAGQSPEVYRLLHHLEINRKATKQELELVCGSSVIAHQNGHDVKLIPGEDLNFKITTQADLNRLMVLASKLN